VVVVSRGEEARRARARRRDFGLTTYVREALFDPIWRRGVDDDDTGRGTRDPLAGSGQRPPSPPPNRAEEDGGVLLVRGWFDGDWDAATREASERPRTDVEVIGSFERFLPACSRSSGHRRPETASASGTSAPEPDARVADGSSLLVAVIPRRFRCATDRVGIAAGEAVRCFLDPP
jgi:hypothetical protein